MMKHRMERSPPLFGVLNLDKPSGITSRDAVNAVERLVRPSKVGHAGTLDPLAEGVLVLCLGPATRLIEYVQRMAKRYVGVFRLGVESPTEDIEGPLRELAGARRPTIEDIQAAARTLTGVIEQTPPRFSAIKVAGRRAYDMARQGVEFDLAPRRVEIHGIDIVRYDYPELALDIRCGGGTYIRSLGRDLAARVGTGAVMTALARTEIGPFRREHALGTDGLTVEKIVSRLEPASRAVASLAQVVLDDHQTADILHGRAIEISASDDAASESAAVDAGGRLLAILARVDERLWRPARVFPVSN